MQLTLRAKPVNFSTIVYNHVLSPLYEVIVWSGNCRGSFTPCEALQNCFLFKTLTTLLLQLKCRFVEFECTKSLCNNFRRSLYCSNYLLVNRFLQPTQRACPLRWTHNETNETNSMKLCTRLFRTFRRFHTTRSARINVRLPL